LLSFSAESFVFQFAIQKYIKIQIYRTMILLVVLYGIETWSLTLRGERRLRVFEKRVLRTIFGPRRDEKTREWKKLHNEEPNDLYSSPNIVRVIKSRRMRWKGHAAILGEKRGVYMGFWKGNLRERDHLEDPGERSWEDNITLDLQEVRCWVMDWIDLAQDRDMWRALLNAVMNLRVP
jgi:hypothetical protein